MSLELFAGPLLPKMLPTVSHNVSAVASASAVSAGFSAGLCWVAASYGITYLFEHRQLKLWLVNGGYHTLQFTLFGAIIGAIQ